MSIGAECSAAGNAVQIVLFSFRIKSNIGPLFEILNICTVGQDQDVLKFVLILLSYGHRQTVPPCQ